MIKKTIKMLFISPAVLLGFSLPFLYMGIVDLFFNGQLLPWSISILGGSDGVSRVWIDIGIGHVFLLLWILLVLPAVMHRLF